jgi:hypothetical protein
MMEEWEMGREGERGGLGAPESGRSFFALQATQDRWGERERRFRISDTGNQIPLWGMTDKADLGIDQDGAKA